jgi:hypothetical protein
MRTRVKMAVIVGTVAVTALACFLLGHHRERDGPLSLTFQRYSDLDPYVGDVAFLRLTNASKKTYLLFMIGNTNALVLDTSFGHFKESWMVNCEFRDRRPNGWTNWIQQPSAYRGSNAYVSLAPHSGIVVRVPLPPNGQQRKVAVLYEPALAGWRQSPFWTSPFGLTVVRTLVRTLPRSALSKISGEQPVLLRAWCDHVLTNQWTKSASSEGNDAR